MTGVVVVCNDGSGEVGGVKRGREKQVRGVVEGWTLLKHHSLQSRSETPQMRLPVHLSPSPLNALSAEAERQTSAWPQSPLSILFFLFFLQLGCRVAQCSVPTGFAFFGVAEFCNMVISCFRNGFGMRVFAVEG